MVKSEEVKRGLPRLRKVRNTATHPPIPNHREEQLRPWHSEGPYPRSPLPHGVERTPQVRTLSLQTPRSLSAPVFPFLLPPLPPSSSPSLLLSSFSQGVVQVGGSTKQPQPLLPRRALLPSPLPLRRCHHSLQAHGDSQSTGRTRWLP